MKPSFSSPAFTIAFLVVTTASDAQHKPFPTNLIADSTVKTYNLNTSITDSTKKINISPAVTGVGKKDNPKTNKTTKRKKKQENGFNPYQPPPPDRKPLPYNSYRESRKPPVTDSLGGEILRTILKDKNHH